MRKEGFGKLVSLDAAKDILFSLSQEVEAEKVSINDALGRVLAEDIIASVDVPPFAKSAMDGYAVIASDTFGASNTHPKTLKQVGQVYPGDFPEYDCITAIACCCKKLAVRAESKIQYVILTSREHIVA